MTTVTVFRRVPPPIIGVCGVFADRAFEAFEQVLDWLETTGVLVDRLDPSANPHEVEPFGDARARLEREGDHCLPLVLVDGVVVSTARHLTRGQLARLVGCGRSATGRTPA